MAVSGPAQKVQQHAEETLTMTNGIDENGRGAVPPWLEVLETDVLELVAKTLRIREGELTPDSDLADYGENSLYITRIMSNISAFYGIQLPSTLYFEANNLRELCLLIAERHADRLAEFYRVSL